MIDLRQPLPGAVEVAGESYRIVTDFRAWIEIERAVREDGACPYWPYIDHPPLDSDWAAPLLAFLSAAPSTPRPGSDASARVVDLIEDGAYITAAFQQVYGVDLTDDAVAMHWHRFRALLISLPPESQLGRIMGYRAWSAGDERRKRETVMADLKRAWSLPRAKAPGDEELVDMQTSMFGAVAASFAEGAGEVPHG